jgi:hypothetical protein
VFWIMPRYLLDLPLIWLLTYTAVQLTRASIAGGYGVASMFSEDLDVREK